MNTKNITYTGKISEYAFIAYFFVQSFFPYDADIIKVVCLLTLFGCLISKMITERRIVFVKTPLNIPIFSLLIWLIFISINSGNTKYSLEIVLHDYTVYFLIFFCVVNTIHESRQIRRIVTAMLIICGLVCIYGLYGYYSGIAVRDGRLIANFEYHSRIAKYISLFFPIAVCLFFYYKDILVKFCFAILIFLCGYSLFLTMSRASWVANTISIIFILLALQKKYLLFVLIGICMLSFTIMPAKYIDHAKTILQYKKFFTSEEILGSRLVCWKAAVEIIKEHPLFGLGPGKRNFREAYRQYIKENLERQKDANANNYKKEERVEEDVNTEEISHAHNIILHVWAETGIIGLAIFLWLFVRIFSAAIKFRKLAGENKYEKMLLTGILACLISICFHGFTDIFWKSPDAMFLWCIVSLLFVITTCDELSGSYDKA